MGARPVDIGHVDLIMSTYNARNRWTPGLFQDGRDLDLAAHQGSAGNA